jgi:hypothetical protein
MDSNINLLYINSNQTAMTFFNNILTLGYIPTNYKATHMGNNNVTLVDQILCNDVKLIKGAVPLAMDNFEKTKLTLASRVSLAT